MRVHHLNLATMCPATGRLLNKQGRLVGHALLVELADGLVLVDAGLGTADLADRSRVGPARWVAGFAFDPAETARAQVEAKGFSASDVRHVVVTHLDVDHAGGLSDFPHATVHVHATELDAASNPSWWHRNRYRAAHFAHGPRWSAVAATGAAWFGFEAVRDLPGLPPEILLVPLFGHSPGHCGVAVDTGGGWLLHAGDAYFHAGEVLDGRGSFGLWAYQALLQSDGRARVANQDRLRALNHEHGHEVSLFCAHDPDEFDRLSGA